MKNTLLVLLFFPLIALALEVTVTFLRSSSSRLEHERKKSCSNGPTNIHRKDLARLSRSAPDRPASGGQNLAALGRLNLPLSPVYAISQKVVAVPAWEI